MILAWLASYVHIWLPALFAITLALWQFSKANTVISEAEQLQAARDVTGRVE